MVLRLWALNSFPFRLGLEAEGHPRGLIRTPSRPDECKEVRVGLFVEDDEAGIHGVASP